MDCEIVKDILLLVVGASVALISSWVTAWIDRETSTSNDLYKQRIESLNRIWIAFLSVRSIYATKVTLGHENWIKSQKEEALKALNDFRSRIDESQVILRGQLITVLRDMDSYLYDVLLQEAQAPSEYIGHINSLLARLSTAANMLFSKRTHAMDLALRT